ncbi:MAG: hypothetical protein ACXWM1_04150 [Candidatus Binataceae bacterium]
MALTALRDRLFTGLFLLLGAAVALSVFLGGAAISEQLQLAIVLAAGTGRLILVVGLTVFAAFHVQALLETREIEAILARSISRAGFVISYWLGLSLLAVVLTGAFGLLIALATRFSAGALLWVGTLFGECTIILAVVLFAALMLERATSAVLFTLGFYALARLMGFFVGIREAVDPTFVMQVAQRGLDFVLLFIPRLDLFAQTRWIVYGAAGETMRFIGLEIPLFLALVLGAAVFDLRRKQF